MREIPKSFVLPDYENSIVNLSAWILKNFGIYHSIPSLNLPVGYKKVALLLIDAFGWKAWEKVKEKITLKNLKPPKRITSVFPSTTTAALTSLYTAALPAEHGMLGFILFLKEYGFLVNMIDLSPFGYKRDLLKDRMNFSLPVETIFKKLSAVGIKSFSLTPSRYIGSGLSKMFNEGSVLIGYTSIGDFVCKFLKVLNEEMTEGLIIGYIPFADSVGHKESEEAYLYEIFSLLSHIETVIAPNIPKDTIFMVTADHGMIRTPKEKEIWWAVEDEIMRYLDMPPGGERRMMHLYSRNPDELLEYLENNYPDKGVFLKKDEAAKLFGGDHQRIGDVVLVALEDYSFNFKYRFEEDSLSGMHGGLSEHEMLVPLFVKET